MNISRVFLRFFAVLVVFFGIGLSAFSAYAYTISFSIGNCPNQSGAGGIAPATITANAGATATLPQNTFICVGYTFNGWFFLQGIRPPGFQFTMPSSNLTAIATWTPKCNTISLNSAVNGGSGGTPSTLYKKSGNASWYTNANCTGSTISSLTSTPVPSLTPPGGQYNGYYTGANGTGTNVADLYGVLDTSWTVVGDTTVYAQYSCLITLYKICGGSNVGAGIPENAYEQQTYREITDWLLQNNGWNTCSDSDFLGWYDNDGQGNNIYLPGEMYAKCGNRPRALWCINVFKNQVNSSFNLNSETRFAMPQDFVDASLAQNINSATNNIISYNSSNRGGCATVNVCNPGYCINTSSPSNYVGTFFNKSNYRALISTDMNNPAAAKCRACTNTKPANSHWSTAGNASCRCQWECDNGYVLNANGTACVQDSAHTVSYSCASGTGTPPQSHTNLHYGDTFTVRQNTCTPPYGNLFSNWIYSYDYSHYYPAATVTFTSHQNETLIAYYSDCITPKAGLYWATGMVNYGEIYNSDGGIQNNVIYAWGWFTYQSGGTAWALPSGTSIWNTDPLYNTYPIHHGDTSLIMPAFTWHANGYVPVAWMCVSELDVYHPFYYWLPGDNATSMIADTVFAPSCNIVSCRPVWAPLCTTGTWQHLQQGVYYNATNHAFVRPGFNTNTKTVTYQTWCDSGYSVVSGANTACPVCEQTTCNVGILWNSGVINSVAGSGTNGHGTMNYSSYNTTGRIHQLPANTSVTNNNVNFTNYQSNCSNLDCNYNNSSVQTHNGFIVPNYPWTTSGYEPVAWQCAMRTSSCGGAYCYYYWQPGQNATSMYYNAGTDTCVNNTSGAGNVIWCLPVWAPICTTNGFQLNPAITNPKPTYYSSSAHAYVSPYVNTASVNPPVNENQTSNIPILYTTWCDGGYYITSGQNGTMCPVCTQCAAGSYDYMNGHGTSCQICPNNYWSDAGWQTCRACDVQNGYVNGVSDYWHGPNASYHAGSQSCKTFCTCGSRVHNDTAPCKPTGANTYALGHTVSYGDISYQGSDWKNCANSYSVGYGAGADDSNDCGKILHTKRTNGADYKYYMRRNRQLPSGITDAWGNVVKLLKVKFNNVEWCADLTTIPNDNLRFRLNNKTYYIYAPQCDWNVEVQANAINDACKIHFPYYHYYNGPMSPDPSSYENWSVFSSSWRAKVGLAIYGFTTTHGMSACTDMAESFPAYHLLEPDENPGSPAPYNGLDACLCKTVNPMFSRWIKPDIYLGTKQAEDCFFDESAPCRDFCPLLCALSFIQYDEFRNRLLDELITGTSNPNPHLEVSPDDWRDLYNVDYGSTWY